MEGLPAPAPVLGAGRASLNVFTLRMRAPLGLSLLGALIVAGRVLAKLNTQLRGTVGNISLFRGNPSK